VNSTNTTQRLLEELTDRLTVNKVIFHLGDISYDLETNGGQNGDDYFIRMEPIISQIPYMFAYGNHEVVQNYTNALARFRMPL